MATVARTARAEIDLIEIWTHIANDDPIAADRQLNKIDEACKMLAGHPHAGKRRDDLASGLRFYPVGNYLIFYIPHGDGVAVARVIHAARDYRTEFLD
jgi:toxin ParE1/3/4